MGFALSGGFRDRAARVDWAVKAGRIGSAPPVRHRPRRRPRRVRSPPSERERRVQGLDLQPLTDVAQASYAGQWMNIQEQFVDAPADAVSGARFLVAAVMTERGYPAGQQDQDQNHDQVLADLSVEHADTLDRYRAAEEISGKAAAGTASTEDLRQAMVHYHALFADLLGEPADGEPADQGSSSAVAAQSTSQQFTASDPEEMAK
jgi:hypothetical protein